ncbi:MAG: N-acetylglucosamine-specific PTS transporter subunit IIBC [Sphingomonas sp.]
MRKAIETLQPLGRALMLPIAVLPVAALLLRLGDPDMAWVPFMSVAGPFMGAAGGAIFAHLGLLFAIGVATGFARDGNGAAALAGVVCFLVTGQGLKLFIDVPPEAVQAFTGDAVKLASSAYRDAAAAKLEIPIGILSGLIGGNFYNRFATVKLPEYLAFFGGRRFVPIAAGVAGLALGVLIGFGYPQIAGGINSASRAIVESGGIGLFVFGLLNRLLIVTGLHHILNNVAWFIVGDYHGATGDLKRFFAGDPNAGAFMSGFFPVMMFGLPAACLAMYHEAKPERRKAVGGMFVSLGLTSFLTGVTEPIEFTFMFLAPLLFLIHAVLTGVAMALMDALNVKLGFGFSAGLFDYVLNYGKATNPLWLLPIGALYALLYYGLFRFTIRKLNLKTPGREDEEAAAPAPAGVAQPRGAAFIAALGGAANLESIDACTTRLRLIVADQSKIDEPALKALGSRGMIKPSNKAVQVVLGPIADAVAMEMRDAAGAAAAFPQAEVAQAETVTLDPALVEALGGQANILEATRLHGRLRIALVDAARSNLDAAAKGFRTAITLPGNVIHLLEQQ